MSGKIEILESGLIIPTYKKLRAAAYVRISSDKEAALNSLSNQSFTYYAQIAANPNWEFAGIYEDCGISGTLEQRPAFQRMLSDCRSGKIDLIITKSFSRFARNTIVLLSVLRELKELGIEVIFENDNIRSLSAGGELLISLLAAKAQAESFSASENQRWRIKKLFGQGLLTGGVRMLGYRSKSKRLHIIPDEAQIVRQIYTDYLSGMGNISIAKKLNSQHIRTINRKLWQKSSVRDVLRNEKYTGSMLLQKTYIKDHISKRRITNKGERTKYHVRGSHEAIIPLQTAEAVREEIKKRAKITSHRNSHLFSGLISCGICGKHYQYKVNNSLTKYAKPIWICSTFNTIGKLYCDNRQIPENILIAKTKEVLGTEDITDIHDKIKSIRVIGKGHLKYFLKDGSEREVHWENPSRRESWTEEMKEKARIRSLERYRRQKSCLVCQ